MKILENVVRQSIEARKLRSSLQASLLSSKLGFSAVEVLYAISIKEEITPSDIASYLFCERATVSRTLRELGEKSLINQRYDTEDRRKAFVKLSPKGIKQLAAFS